VPPPHTHTVINTQNRVLLLRYIIAMLPAGWAVQRFGPKLLLGLDNYLQGAALMCVPAAAKMGTVPLCLCMAAMGAAQAPIFPAQSVMKRDFQGGLPASMRPWAIQFMRLSAAAGEIFSKWSTPIISITYGWQMVCYVYGGVSLGFGAPPAFAAVLQAARVQAPGRLSTPTAVLSAVLLNAVLCGSGLVGAPRTCQTSGAEKDACSKRHQPEPASAQLPAR
jgi:hypothetical protein